MTMIRAQCRRVVGVGAVLLAVTLGPATGRAQAPDGRASVGTLIVAHGGGPEWNAQVDSLAAAVRLPGPVGVTFLMGPGSKRMPFQVAVDSLVRRGARRIVVVPLLVSSHSGHYDQIRYLAGELDTLPEVMMHHLHMGGISRPAAAVPMSIVRAMDDAPEIAAALADRALALAKDPRAEALFILGHGPNSAEDYAAWMANLRRVADTVAARTGFRSVLLGLVRDDAPPPVRQEAVTRIRELIRLQHELTGRPVVVVPVLVASGQVSRVKFAKDLEGLPVTYAGEALLPHPSLARWVERRVTEADRGLAGVAGESRR